MFEKLCFVFFVCASTSYRNMQRVRFLQPHSCSYFVHALHLLHAACVYTNHRGHKDFEKTFALGHFSLVFCCLEFTTRANPLKTKFSCVGDQQRVEPDMIPPIACFPSVPVTPKCCQVTQK